MRLLRSPRLVSAVPTFTSSRSMSPRANQGRVLGHEGVGFIEAVGAGVATFKPRERVIISCISACGRCEYCRKGMYSNCVNGGPR
jgi:alcohol dehydrogenase